MLKRLTELPDWRLADTAFDVRGWKVFDKDNREIGAVESLIVDTDQSMVRYLGIRCDEHLRLIPVNRIQIDREACGVFLKDLSYQDMAEIPEFAEVCDVRDNSDYVPSEEDLDYRALEFEPVAIADLVSDAWNRPENLGRLVSFEGSFGHIQEDTWQTMQTTYSGYKIWDRAGNGIRCTNVYTAIDRPTERIDTSHEFNLEAMNRIAYTYGTYVKVEGRFVPDSCGGEPGIDVYYIDGRPVAEYLGSER